MKTFWASKYLNCFNQNSSLILAARRKILLIRDANGYSLSLCKIRSLTLISTARWRPSSRCVTISKLWNSYFAPQFARKFHSSGTLGKNDDEKKPETLQDLIETTERPETAVTVGQKVAQAGKDVSYFAVMMAGFAVTGALLWYVFSELFLSSSPNKIYADALKKVKRNEEVIDALGKPIKGYGEETSRGRRRHVSFQEYIVAGENYMRVKFYIAGHYRKGTVHVDVKQVSSRNYEYRFIFVELDGFPARTIVIEDNR